MDGFEKYLRSIIYQLLVICSMWDDEKKKKRFRIRLQVSGFNSCWMVGKLPVIHMKT